MAAEVDGLIYLVSGDPTDLDDPKQRRLDTLEAFDPKTATWKSLASLPKVDDGENGRSSGTVGVIDGKIYLAGGWRHKPPLPTKTLLIYDPPTNSWEGDEGMPSICGDSVGGVIGRKFYVLNGTNGQDGIRHLFYVYDPDRKTWEGRKSAHEPHGHGAGEVIGGKLYVVGGDNGNGPSGGLEVYDPGTDRWTSLAPMPTPRVRAAAAVISGRLVVLGGNNGKSTLATVEAYDPRTDLWTTLPDLPESRQGAAAAVVGSRLYVMGGQRLGSNLKAFDVFTLSKSR